MKWELFSYIDSHLFHHLWVTTNQHKWPAPSWLCSLVAWSECCFGIAEVKGSNPIQAWVFSGCSFINSFKVDIFNCEGHHHYFLISSAVPYMIIFHVFTLRKHFVTKVKICLIKNVMCVGVNIQCVPGKLFSGRAFSFPSTVKKFIPGWKLQYLSTHPW